MKRRRRAALAHIIEKRRGKDATDMISNLKERLADPCCFGSGVKDVLSGKQRFQLRDSKGEDLNTLTHSFGTYPGSKNLSIFAMRYGRLKQLRRVVFVQVSFVFTSLNVHSWSMKLNALFRHSSFSSPRPTNLKSRVRPDRCRRVFDGRSEQGGVVSVLVWLMRYFR